MTVILNEDDIGYLKSLKYKIKSCLENPTIQNYKYWECVKEMEALLTRLKIEGKSIPESDDYLVLDDMKLLMERFFDGIIEEVEKREGV